jgi:TatD DNase family protein
MKYKWANKFYGNDLKLEVEPSCKEVIESIKDHKEYNEIIFCGYGDSLINIEMVKDIAKWVKEHNGKIRINTAGLANRYHGRNILPELKYLVDVISISLNGSNPQEHNEFNNPMFKEESFDEILKFTKEAKNYIQEVIITTIKFPGFDISKVEAIAKEIGVCFRSRPYLDNDC